MDAYDRIEKLMLEHGEKASDLAKATGMSTGLLSQWKSRMQKPSAAKLSKVAAHYGVTTDYLLGNLTLGIELQKIMKSESNRLGVPEDELTQAFTNKKPFPSESIKLSQENIAHYFDSLYSSKENPPAVSGEGKAEDAILFSAYKAAPKNVQEAIRNLLGLK